MFNLHIEGFELCYTCTTKCRRSLEFPAAHIRNNVDLRKNVRNVWGYQGRTGTSVWMWLSGQWSVPHSISLQWRRVVRSQTTKQAEEILHIISELKIEGKNISLSVSFSSVIYCVPFHRSYWATMISITFYRDTNLLQIIWNSPNNAVAVVDDIENIPFLLPSSQRPSANYYILFSFIKLTLRKTMIPNWDQGDVAKRDKHNTAFPIHRPFLGCLPR